jgi:O-antigen/teichoic acid export membrane protein
MSGVDRGRAGASVRRGSWAVASELVDSASNFLLSVWIARAVSTREFGAFGIVYVSLQLALLVSRASGSMPMMIDGLLDHGRAGRDTVARVFGITLAIALAASLVAVGIGLALDGLARPLLFATAFCLPGVLLVDCCCYVFFARREPRRAFFSQFVWLMVQLAAFLIARQVFDVRHAWVFLALWGAASYLAVAASLVALSVLPAMSAGWVWWREHRRTVRDLVAEATVGQAAQQVIVYVLGLGVSVAGVGAYRAAQLPFGLLRSVFQGLVPVGVVEGAQLRASNPRRLLRLTLVWDAAVVVLTVLLGLVLWAMPRSVGGSLFGASWVGGHHIILAMMLASTASSAIVPVQTALRALAATRRLLVARVVLTAAQVVGLCAGMLSGGLRDAIVGLAAGYLAGAVAAWVLLGRSVGDATAALQRH